MRWITGTIITTAFALALWVMVAATHTVRVLGPADLTVMEFQLRRQGNQVRVISGILVQAAGEVRAVLKCRTDGGLVFTWDYPLGQDDPATFKGD